MTTNEFSRRSFMQLLGVVAGVGATGGLLTACGSGPNSNSGSKELQINSFGGTFQSAVQKAVVPPFETKYGATVGVTTALSSAALTKLKASPKNKPALDVAYMDVAVVYQAKAAGLVQKIDMSKLSSIPDVYPLAIDKGGYWIAELAAMTGIAYNTDKIKTPPTSWQDLWDPKYAGHVSISDISGTAGYQFLVEAARLNGGSEANIDPGFAALKRLKPNIGSIYKTPDEMIQRLTSGEAWIGPGYSDRTSAAKQKGAPIDFVQPKEGAIVVLSAMCLPAGTAALDLAYKYIDFQMSTDVQRAFVTTIGEGPTNSKVILPEQFVKDNDLPYGQKGIEALVQQDSEAIAQQLSNWTTRWAAEVAS